MWTFVVECRPRENWLPPGPFHGRAVCDSTCAAWPKYPDTSAGPLDLLWQNLETFLKDYDGWIVVRNELLTKVDSFETAPMTQPIGKRFEYSRRVGSSATSHRLSDTA